MLHRQTRVMSRDVSPGFSYCQLRPAGEARGLVDYYWSVQAARCRTAIESALPDTAVEVYFNLGPRGRHVADPARGHDPGPRSAWIMGPRTHPLLVAKETLDCDIVGVRLRPCMAARLLQIPADELVGSLVDLEHFWGSLVEEIREQLAVTTGAEARIEILERALARRAGRVDRRFPEHEAGQVRTLCAMVACGRATSVAQVADAAGLTHRKVISLFERHVGLKPKTYQRIERIRQVMRAAIMPRRPPWAQLAIQSGFCDQAHLIHEFRRLTGMTPVDYARRRSKVGDGYVPFRFGTDPDPVTARPNGANGLKDLQ